MTLVLELPENLEQQLRDKAAEMKVSPEAFVVSVLEKAVSREERSVLSDTEFEAASKYVLEKNAELYRRLA